MEDSKGEPSKLNKVSELESKSENSNITEKSSSVCKVDIEAVIDESNLSQIRNSVNENSIQLWKDLYYDKAIAVEY